MGKDVGVQEGTGRICTSQARKGDLVIVQEKLDGSNVAIANVDGVLIALTRSGKPAVASQHEHHRMFAQWVVDNHDLFTFLQPGERLCGEWLALAHGTIYKLPHAPFVVFDLIIDSQRSSNSKAMAGFDSRIPRLTFDKFTERCSHLVRPQVVHKGEACSVARALELIDPTVHGAVDPVEGCVWRVEREGRVDILAKYVRPDKVDGCYLPEVSGKDPIWLWKPTKGK